MTLYHLYSSSISLSLLWLSALMHFCCVNPCIIHVVLNNCRRSRRSKMVSLKERQSKPKRVKNNLDNGNIRRFCLFHVYIWGFILRLAPILVSSFSGRLSHVCFMYEEGAKIFPEATDNTGEGCNYRYAYSWVKKSNQNWEWKRENICHTVTKDDHGKCFQEWEKLWDECFAAQAEHSEGD